MPDFLSEASTEIQQGCYFNDISALSLALRRDINDEFELHGFDSAGALVRPLLSPIYSQTEEAVVLLPFLKHHIDRYLDFEPRDENSHSFVFNALVSLARYLEMSAYPGLQAYYDSIIRFATDFRAIHAILSPLEELSWFEVRRLEATMVLNKANSRNQRLSAIGVLERNLRDDPLTEHDFVPAIRRVQLQNLQDWVGCISSLSPIETTEDAAEAFANRVSHLNQNRSALATFANIPDAEWTLIMRLPFGEKFAPLLQRHQEVMATFGTLAKRLLAEPEQNSFLDVLPEGFDLRQFALALRTTNVYGGVLDLSLDIWEGEARRLGGDTEGARRVLQNTLQQQRRGDWTMRVDVHGELYNIAAAAGDWRQAILHLDAQWNLHGGNVEPEIASGHHLRYAICSQKLGDLRSVFQHALKASVLAINSNNRELLVAVAVFMLYYAPLEDLYSRF
jgi:hypothetical protein